MSRLFVQDFECDMMGTVGRNGKVIRTTYFIIAFLFLIHAARASDERSIKELAKALVVTARNQPFDQGIIIDGWRRAGRLFWCQVKRDDEYEAEQHYGHSGITMWRENMKWSVWLQEYQSTEQKPKAATASNKS